MYIYIIITCDAYKSNIYQVTRYTYYQEQKTRTLHKILVRYLYYL